MAGGPTSAGSGVQGEIGRRLADEDRDRVLELGPRDAEVGRLGARRLELRLGLRHVDPRHDSLPVAIGRELKRLLVVGDVRLEKPSLSVDPPELEVVERQLGVQAQTDGFEVGRARLGGRHASFDVSPNAPPRVGFPREVERQREVVCGGPDRAGRHPGRGRRPARPGRGGARGHGRKQIGTRPPDRRARAPVLRFGQGDVLVRDVDLGLESVQDRVPEDLPPPSAGRAVSRLRRLPGAGVGRVRRRELLVGRRHLTGGFW